MQSNPLTEALPAKYRSYLYAALFVAAVVLGAWQAADGDLLEAAVGALAALGFGTAQANTPKE